MDREQVDALLPVGAKEIGYSGLFSVESNWVGTPEELAVFEATLPKLLLSSGWLAVAVNRELDPPTIVLVRRDSNAVVEALTGHEQGVSRSIPGRIPGPEVCEQ